MNDNLQNQLQLASKRFLQLRVPLFLLLVAIVYGFIIWRIDELRNAPPPAEAIASKLQSSTHIDPTTVNKIKQLQDNDVNVRVLFDQARKNPFQE